MTNPTPTPTADRVESATSQIIAECPLLFRSTKLIHCNTNVIIYQRLPRRRKHGSIELNDKHQTPREEAIVLASGEVSVDEQGVRSKQFRRGDVIIVPLTVSYGIEFNIHDERVAGEEPIQQCFASDVIAHIPHRVARPLLVEAEEILNELKEKASV